MVHGPDASPRGARARRQVTPALANLLRDARIGCGLSVREAARRAGVASGTIGHLEHARRAPSLVVAEAIAAAYDLEPSEAGALLAEAVSDAGRSSPLRRLARFPPSVSQDVP